MTSPSLMIDGQTRLSQWQKTWVAGCHTHTECSDLSDLPGDLVLFVQVQNRHCRGLCLITSSQSFISRHPQSVHFNWLWMSLDLKACLLGWNVTIRSFKDHKLGLCGLCSVWSELFCNFLFSRCISIFFVEFQMHFARDYSGTAWIHSLVDCTTMLCGNDHTDTKAITHWRITIIIIGWSEKGFPSAELSYKMFAHLRQYCCVRN